MNSASPAPPPPVVPEAILVRSLWQVVTYILGAMLVGSWVWVWNTNNALRDLQAALARVPEVMLRAEANRTVIDSYAARLAQLEESTRSARDDRENLRRQVIELRLAVSGITASVGALRIDHGRIADILRMAGVRPPATTPEHEP